MMKIFRLIRWVLYAVLFIGILAMAGIAVFWKPLVLHITQDSIQKAFPDAAVSIGTRAVTSRTLTFGDIRVTRAGQPYLRVGTFRLDFTLGALLRDHTAGFSLQKVEAYSKVRAERISGTVAVNNDTVLLDHISADIMNGTVQARVRIVSGNPQSFIAELSAQDLQLEKVISTFELNEKIDMTGSLSGTVRICGEGSRITFLKGDLTSATSGGILTVKDKKWLDMIAGYAKKDLAVIVESFRNYRYNSGSLRLGLEDAAIVVDAHFQGDTGKRDLLLTLHNLTF